MPGPAAVIGEGARVGDLCGAVAVRQTVQTLKRSVGCREEDIGSAPRVHLALNGLDVRIKLPQDRMDAAREGAIGGIQKVHIDRAIDDLAQSAKVSRVTRCAGTEPEENASITAASKR